MAEFAAMMRVWNRKQEREELRIAKFEALYAEAHRDSSKRAHPFTANDFMPSHLRQSTQPATVDIEASNAQAISLLRGITQALAERDGEKLQSITDGVTP